MGWLGPDRMATYAVLCQVAPATPLVKIVEINGFLAAFPKKIKSK